LLFWANEGLFQVHPTLTVACTESFRTQYKDRTSVKSHSASG